jgi:hypothetical protein
MIDGLGSKRYVMRQIQLQGCVHVGTLVVWTVETTLAVFGNAVCIFD